MEDVKGLPFHHAYRVFGAIFVPLMGGMLLLLVWIYYRRSTSDFAGLNAISVALPAAAVGLAYFKARRVLLQLEAQLKEAQLAAIWACLNTITFLGYLVCMAAVSFGHQLGPLMPPPR